MAARTALVRCADPAVADAVAHRLSGDGLRVVAAAPDADPAAEVARTVADLGSVDAVVCGVDQPAPGPFLGADPQRWYADVMTCLTPPFRLVRAAVPALRASGAGRVVLLGSGWTTADRAGTTAASAAHGAVVALVKTLARDLGPEGVTVNEVVADPAEPPAPAALAAAVGYLCTEAAGAVVGQLLTLGRGGSLRP